jgi:hypothetical protein
MIFSRFRRSTAALIVAFMLLFLLGAGVRLLTFTRFLPYLDYSDESHMYLLTRAWRGVEEQAFMAQRLSGYPPLYIWIQSAVQSGFETLAQRPWYLPSDYIYVLRLIAVGVGVLTLACIVAIGWQVAGSIAGWFAGLIWALSPIVVDNNSLAIADPFGYLACAGAIAAALRAWQKRSLTWLFVGLLASIAAIYIKYWTLYPLFLWFIVAVRMVWFDRRTLLGLALQVGVGLIAAAGLLRYVLTAGLSPLSPEMTNFSSTGIATAFEWSRNLNNLRYLPIPIGVEVFWGGVLLGLAAYGYSRRQGMRVVDWRLVVLLAITAIVAAVPISSFIYISSLKYIRHAIPITILLIGLWGAAIAQIIWTLASFAEQRQDKRWSPVLPAAAGLAVLGLVGVPYMSSNLDALRLYQHTPIQQRLWRWTDVNVPVDGLILMDARSRVEDTWNRPWSGYDGSKTFQWWFEKADDMVQTPAAQYIQRGIVYFAMSDDDRKTVYASPEADAFLKRLTLVKTIPATPDTLGATVHFFRLMPPQVSTQFEFGNQIVLAGYDVSSPIPGPGGSLKLRPYWRIERRPNTNYSMFVHLYPKAGETLITQHDGPPTVLERPTLTWDDTDELYIGADVQLTLPSDLKPGDYRLALGLYDYTNGQRLTGADGATYYSIPISVAAEATS